jgi:hypothetical protein
LGAQGAAFFALARPDFFWSDFYAPPSQKEKSKKKKKETKELKEKCGVRETRRRRELRRRASGSARRLGVRTGGA